jgi:nucleotide-binding universal stress UspA family protein
MSSHQVPGEEWTVQTMHDRPTVLIPVRVLERESIPEGVPELLTNAHVVLLGYHVVPDQTATGQARDQFEDQATRRLDDLTAILEHAGATVESHLVFTHDAQTTIDRATAEHDCLAVLIPNATRPLEEVLVAVRGLAGADRFVRLVGGLFGPEDVDVTLFHVAEESESDADVAELLDEIATRLSEAGVPEASIATQSSRGDDHRGTIVDAADDYDAIVMGESDPSVTTFLFGMTADQVAREFLGPVFVVQHEKTEDGEESAADSEEPAADGENSAAGGEESAADSEEPAADGEESAADGEDSAADGEESGAG